MAQKVESIEESKARTGKSFVYILSNATLDNLVSEDILIRTFDDLVTITTMQIESDAERMSWQAWIGTDATGGTPLTPFSRNQRAASSIDALVVTNPVVNALGNPAFDPAIDLVAQDRQNAAYMDEILFENFILRKNTTYLIRITNSSSGNDKRLDINMNVFKE